MEADPGAGREMGDGPVEDQGTPFYGSWPFSRAVVLPGGREVIPSPRGIWQCLEIFLVITPGEQVQLVCSVQRPGKEINIVL